MAGKYTNHKEVAYVALQDDISRQFHKPLHPVLMVQHIFGQSFLSNSNIINVISKILFLLTLTFMCFVFWIAVFNRGDSIETWIQLSLYMIPLLTFPCGAKIFGSAAYYRLLCRNLTDSFMVRFFVTGKSSDDITEAKPAAHNRKWLKRIAIKSIIFPIILEVIQWGGFAAFSLKEHSVKPFVGNVTKLAGHKIDDDVWDGMYYAYWTLSFYLVGFVSFQFVFVCRIIVKDTVSFMSLFGNSSLLKLYPVYDYSTGSNCCFNIIIYLVNFLTMDLLASFSDQYVYSNCAQLTRQQNQSHDEKKYSIVPSRVLTSPVVATFHSPLTVAGAETPDHKDLNENGGSISPGEACEVFSVFIAEIEELTSIFTPFTVVIAFFGVANLVTHVCLFVDHDTRHISYWTLFRTILFLFVAVRMLLCVQQVSSVIGKLPTHVKFVKTSGKLSHMTTMYPSWDNFLELLDSFNLGKRSFGFPLTLRQVASIATALNMAFLIVLSVFKSGDSSKSIFRRLKN